MKILSTVGLTPEQRRGLERAAGGAELVDRQCRSMAEIADAVAQGCDVLLAFRVPRDVLERAPELKWVQFLSAGVDHNLKGQLAESNIPVTTASGIHAAPIAEYTIGSMLAFAHRFHITTRAQLRHLWLRSLDFMDSAFQLRGKVLGVIGYGSIGRETARVAQALGMTVLALKRDPASLADFGWCPAGVGDPEGRIPSRFFGPAERQEILGQSDFVAVTLPLTAETRGIIGAGEIGVMKRDAYIVNIGRGEVIDQAALIEALRSGKIGGAGLDVFEREPLEAESPLWDMENVILTPHMAGAYMGYVGYACELFEENLRRFVSGRPLLNQINRALGY